MYAVASVRKLFPDVTTAVQHYQQAKDDREARNLARRVGNEKALYDQFTRQLSQLCSTAATKTANEPLRNIGSKFGQEVADALKGELNQMGDLLRGLKADLENISRGTEVLAKLRPKTSGSRSGFPRSPLQKRLDDLSKANQRLASYLQDGQTAVPLVMDFQGPLGFRLSIHMHGNDQSDGFLITSEGYTCHCEGSVPGKTTPTTHQSENYGVNKAPSHLDWNEDAVSQRHSSSQLSIAVQDLEQMIEKNSQARDSSSLSDTVEEGNESLSRKLSELDGQEKTIHLGIKRTSIPPTTVSLEDLMLHRGMALDQKSRVELALRLSSAVLLLWNSPWMVDSSAWIDWAVSFDEGQNDEPCSLYLRPKSRPDEDSRGGTMLSRATFFILAKEPVLSLLGVRIIELAFGQSLAELGHEDSSLACGEGLDKDSVDLLTARKLLALHRISQRFGQSLEDVVNVCLNQQYRVRKGSRITELNLCDQSFLDRAVVGILLPLYREMIKLSGCTCNVTVADGPQQGSVKDESLQPESDKGHTEGGNRASSNSEQVATEKTQMPVAGVNVELFQDPGTSLDPTDSPSSLSAVDASDGVNSRGIFLRGNQVESSEHFQDLSTDEGDPGGSEAKPSISEVSAKATNPESGENGGQIGASMETLSSKTENLSSKESQNIGNGRFQHIRLARRPHTASRDGDAASACSYDTMTVTTDSAFAWLSDQSEEPPGMPKNHPLLLFQNVALRILLRLFQSWREHGNGEKAPSSSANRATPSRKRTRPGSEQQRDDGDDEEGASSLGVPSVSNKKRRVTEGSLTLACPFFKKDVKAHSRCCRYLLSRTKDVKQHLLRRHQIPMYCPRCNQVFVDENDRDEHIRGARCEERPPQKPEGLTEQQKRQLGKRVPANQSAEEQWFGIWDMLFPDHEPRPESPYIDSGLLENVLAYQSFFSARGPQILNNVLTARGAVTWHLPEDESDMQAFQHSLFEEGIQEVFREWTGSGGTAVPEAQAATSMAPESAGGVDTEQLSMSTPPCYPAPSSSHVSSGLSLDEQSEWLFGSQLDNDFAPFGPMTAPEIDPMTAAETEEVLRICRDLNQNMGFQ